MKKIYLVEKTITLSRHIEANTSKEAEAIAFDMGDIDALTDVKDWHYICRWDMPDNYKLGEDK